MHLRRTGADMALDMMAKSAYERDQARRIGEPVREN